MCQFIYREFTPIKIFLGQWGIVLVKEGGHTAVSATTYIGLFQNKERS